MISIKTLTYRLLPMLLIVALLAGCSGSKPAANVEPESAAQAILDGVDFKAELTKADEGAAKNFYRIDDSIADYAIYINGATVPAEEIAVLKAVDASKLGDAEKIVNRRIEDLQFQFENYHPEELTKINNPVIVAKGDIVVMVLADDTEQAKKVVDGLFQ